MYKRKNKQKVTGQRDEETEVQVMEEELYTKVKDELRKKNVRWEERKDEGEEG